MSHEVWRLRESLYNTPLYSDQETLNSVVGYLNARNRKEVDIKADMLDDDEESSSYIYNEDTQTAVMDIIGPLTYKPVSFMGMSCGGQSYTALKADMEDAVARGAKTVVFNVDSGGGYAFGMIQAGQYIRKLADDNGIEILAYVDGRSASAAYGLTSIADQIIGHPDASLGSVGVIIELFNDHKALEMEGYERSFIYAGAEKQPWADDGSWRPGFLQSLKESVDDSYEKFTTHVATMRSMSVEAVKNTEAAMFPIEQAIELGLADLIMDPEEFYSYLADRAQTNMETKPMSVKDRFFKFSKSDGAQTEMAQLQELQAQLSAAQEQLATMADLKGAVSTLTASLAEKEAAFASMKAKLAELEGAKAQAAVDSRRAMLAEQLPADQVDMNLNALASLDDASFSVIVGQFKATKDARAASFEEAGGEGVESEAPEKQQSEASLIDKIRAVGVASAKAMK